jgi:hypothetical protein
MSTAGSCRKARKCAHGNEGKKEGRNGRRRSKRMQLPSRLLPPNTLAQSEPNFGKVVGWFENLVASIRIKIRIYKNYPVLSAVYPCVVMPG